MAEARPVLFCCTQSTGLINSSLVLAAELAERGVPDLWFASDDNRQAEVEKTSSVSQVRFVPLGPVDDSLAATRWDDETYREVTQRSRFKAQRARVRVSMKADFTADKYRRLCEAVDEIRPALMVINSLATYALQVAVVKRVPFIVVAPFLPGDLCPEDVGPDYPAPLSGLPRERTFRQEWAHRYFRLRMATIWLDWKILSRSAKYLRAMRELDVPQKFYDPAKLFKRAEKILCFSLLELDYPFVPPANLVTVGNLVPPLPETDGDDALTRWLDACESVVYVAFGTITRLTAGEVSAMVEVARTLEGEHHVLWKLPLEQQHLLPPADQLPGNLRIEDWLPSQYDVLAHPSVRVFFNHGGSNSFHEGLYFGKPLLVRPLWLDCYDHAVRAVESGAGLTVDRPNRLDADDVVAKLRALTTDPKFRRNAERIAELQRAAGGAAAAADVVVQTVRPGAPTR
ncbi:MAG: glycosyltransferase [Umezawaea sp.]